MKRQRRMLPTMMGTAACGAVSIGLVSRGDCDAGLVAAPCPDDRLDCLANRGGFGRAPRGFRGPGPDSHTRGGG